MAKLRRFNRSVSVIKTLETAHNFDFHLEVDGQILSYVDQILLDYLTSKINSVIFDSKLVTWKRIQ